MAIHDALRDIPPARDKRIAVRVTNDAVRQIRGGHPWVFDNSITAVSGVGTPGDLAVIVDRKRNFVAIGLYDPGSVIRVRVLHHGRPQTIDGAWFRDGILAALDRRQSLAAGSDTDGYRCIHGENDGFPGLVVDRYRDTYVVKLYSAVWLPHLRTVVEIIESLCGPESVVLRLARAVAADDLLGLHEGMTIAGTVPAPLVPFVENGLTFEADVVHGQKTGHFLDQRENRATVRRLAKGCRVLDVFCCTGGFSVHAAAGGALSVHSVDSSGPALDAVTRHFVLNLAAVGSCRHGSTEGDAFRVMDQLHQWGERYDMVIVDPPSFAPRQSNVAVAVRAHCKLTSLAIDLLRPAGLLVQSSCSSRVNAAQFHRSIDDVAADRGVTLRDITRTAEPLDHPVGFAQGAYLKTRFTTIS